MMNAAPIKSWLIAACLPNIDIVCNEISEWLMERGLAAHLFAMELLTREALNNAILHGCKLDPNRLIRCELQRAEDSLYLTISDDGVGFPWQEHIHKEIVDFDHECGRGIYLYRLYADSVEFNQCGNQVTLVRLLKSEGR